MFEKIQKLVFDSTFTLYLMLVPAILMVMVFAIYPLFYNFSLSVHKVNMQTMISGARPFVGLENYIQVFTSDEFVTIFINTVFFTVFSVIFQFLIGLSTALFFNQEFPFHKQLRGLLLIGWVIPPAVIGTIWRWLFNSDIGVLNYLLTVIGFGSVPWLVDADVALVSVLIANVWYSVPFNMILLTAGLVSIPEQVHDAAAIDGATYFQKLWNITLPMIKPNIFAVVILDLIYTFRSFPLIWNMTKGGPVNATTVLPVWSYINSFRYFKFGIGTAISVLIFIMLSVASIIYIRIFVYSEEGVT